MDVVGTESSFEHAGIRDVSSAHKLTVFFPENSEIGILSHQKSLGIVKLCPAFASQRYAN